MHDENSAYQLTDLENMWIMDDYECLSKMLLMKEQEV